MPSTCPSGFFDLCTGGDNERLHPKHDVRSAEHIDPSMWGLNIKDIDDFTGDVAKKFADYKCGKGDEHYRQEYNDRDVGPSVYTVTQKLIRPKAEEHNGLSWALMRHEDGLECHGFASHAWIEGIYEFVSKLRKRWPRHVVGMYICFLSNPQIGVKSVLGSSIQDSPFHKALTKATHVIVVPNRLQSIYTRLWCAYEVYYAMKRAEESELTIELAFDQPRSLLVFETFCGLLTIACGFIFSYNVVAPRIGMLLGPVMWLVTTFIVCLVLSICGRAVLKRITKWFCTKHEYTESNDDDAENNDHAMEKNDKETEKQEFRIQLFLSFLELFLFSIASGCAMRHLWVAITARWSLDVEYMESDGDPFNKRRHGMQGVVKFRNSIFYHAYFEEGEEVPCMLLAIGMISVFFQHIFLVLIRQVIRKESHMLEFKGLDHARAAKPEDETRLKNEIANDKQSVENLIEMLRSIGRYNAVIRANVRRGLGWKQARDGASMLAKALTAVIAWEFWWMADMSGRAHVGWVLAFATLTSLLVVGLLHMFGDRAIFAVEVFFWMGLTFVIVSNWTLFWREEFVEGLKMSASTCVLQVGMLALSVILCYLFYFEHLRGPFKKVHAWKGHLHQHSNDLVRRRRSSLAAYQELPTNAFSS